MICERFEIVVVPFPFVDSARTKPRPALVLSSRAFNRANRHTVLAMITRATHTKWPSDRAIANLPASGLRALQRRIGQLGNDDARSCAAALDAILRS